MTKDILFSPISRAPSIWIVFAKIAAVPVLLSLIFFHPFFFIYIVKILLRAMLFFKTNPADKTKYTQRQREDEHSTFQYKKRGRQSNRKHKHNREKVTKKKQTLEGTCHHPLLMPQAVKWEKKNHFMTCDQRNMFKTTFHKHNTQALEQSHQPTTTINHSSPWWEPQLWMLQIHQCDRCRTRFANNSQQQTSCFAVLSVVHIYQYALERSRTPQDSRQVTEQVWSQWDCCLRPVKRMKCFLATAGGHQRVKNRRYLSFQPPPLHPGTTYWISPTLSPSLFWPQTVRLFIFTTWPIYKTASWWVLLQKRGPSLWSSSRSLAERLSLQL